MESGYLQRVVVCIFENLPVSQGVAVHQPETIIGAHEKINIIEPDEIMYFGIFLPSY